MLSDDFDPLIAQVFRTRPADLGVRGLAGALVGVVIAQQPSWVRHPEIDVLESIDKALAFLDGLLPNETATP